MNIPTKSHAPDARHEAFLAELKAALGNSGKDLPAEELLAVASQFVGMLVAMQDQRRFTPDMCMEVVARNLETGNMAAIEAMLGTTDGAA